MPTRRTTWSVPSRPCCAATESLVINISRQGLIYIPAMFCLGALFDETGLIWAQPVADVLSLALAIVLHQKSRTDGKIKMRPYRERPDKTA